MTISSPSIPVNFYYGITWMTGCIAITKIRQLTKRGTDDSLVLIATCISGIAALGFLATRPCQINKALKAAIILPACALFPITTVALRSAVEDPRAILISALGVCCLMITSKLYSLYYSKPYSFKKCFVSLVPNKQSLSSWLKLSVIGSFMALSVRQISPALTLPTLNFTLAGAITAQKCYYQSKEERSCLKILVIYAVALISLSALTVFFSNFLE